MKTNTIIRVYTNIDFTCLIANTRKDKPLEALWDIEDTGKADCLMNILAADVNAQVVVPDADDIFDIYADNYMDYIARCEACEATTSDNKAILAIMPMTFDNIRCKLNQLPDKTAFELVRLVRKHTTKEKLMQLISDRIEPNTIPNIKTIANIIISVTDKYLDTDSIWS